MTPQEAENLVSELLAAQDDVRRLRVVGTILEAMNDQNNAAFRLLREEQADAKAHYEWQVRDLRERVELACED